MGEVVMVSAPAAAKYSRPPPTSLAPGFRFHPTDEELVRYYLTRKACKKPFRFQAVTEVDVYKSEPWELAVYSSLKNRDQEWYFFSPTDRKYGNGARLNRATGQGYWKATGKDRPVRHRSKTIGMKKTLVFHGGRAPDGKRTNWVMHEYRLCDSELEMSGVSQEAFVLCRIFQKSGLGPPNGNRYAPFVEEEWDEDTAIVVPGVDIEDDTANGDEERAERTEFGQNTQAFNMGPLQIENPISSCSLHITCKRERSEKPELLSLAQTKKVKRDETSHGNGSEDSGTSSQSPPMMMTTNVSSSLLEFPLLEPLEPKDNQPADLPLAFDSSNLEKSVPPGYLKFISNLEQEIVNVTMERETLKIEVMRAQAMINFLHTRIEILAKDNEEIRRRILE